MQLMNTKSALWFIGTGFIILMYVYQVYLLVHTCEAKVSGQQRIKNEKMQNIKESKERDSQGDQNVGLDEGRSSDTSLGDHSLENGDGASLEENRSERMMDQRLDNTTGVEGDAISCEWSNRDGGDDSKKTRPGVFWDVFRRQDVPQVIEYLRIHHTEFVDPNSEKHDLVIFILIFTNISLIF